ncbi:Hypothetical protein SMAX5B_015465 [Scophthalmus maximus]|uniref:Uncharacterized protein n=1 Tax=Scophthalmus maximus TaxID=52904 RepID=A0A2U9BXD3_SCOMX|nr:Hypothetical protein SMAX5B_015465 [Scophthalmus maximus]
MSKQTRCGFISPPRQRHGPRRAAAAGQSEHTLFGGGEEWNCVAMATNHNAVDWSALLRDARRVSNPSLLADVLVTQLFPHDSNTSEQSLSGPRPQTGADGGQAEEGEGA